MDSRKLVRICERLIDDLGVAGASAKGLAVAIGQGKLGKVPEGTVICLQGDPSDTMYVVVRGTVEVEIEDTSGVPRTLTTLTAPAVIGAMGVMDRSPRSATCVATSPRPALVVELDLDTLDGLMKRSDRVGSSLRRVMGASMAAHLGAAYADAARLARVERQARQPRVEPDASGMAEIDGLIGRWNLDTSDLDSVEVVAQEAHMRRDGRSR